MGSEMCIRDRKYDRENKRELDGRCSVSLFLRFAASVGFCLSAVHCKKPLVSEYVLCGFEWFISQQAEHGIEPTDW